MPGDQNHDSFAQTIFAGLAKIGLKLVGQYMM